MRQEFFRSVGIIQQQLIEYKCHKQLDELKQLLETAFKDDPDLETFEWPEFEYDLYEPEVPKEALREIQYIQTILTQELVSAKNAMRPSWFEFQKDVPRDSEADADEHVYCICKQPSYGDMIACDNPKCQIEWFHLPCVDLTEIPEGPWLCGRCNERHESGNDDVSEPLNDTQTVAEAPSQQMFF